MIPNSGWYGVRWWEFEVPDDCTIDDMERALSYSLLVVQYPVYSETEISELGLVREAYCVLILHNYVTFVT